MFDTAPEPGFEGLSWYEITQVIDEFESEQALEQSERDRILRNRWS